MKRWIKRLNSRKTAPRARLGLNTLEDRLMPALPVLMVIANQDFYYQEYNDTRNSLQAKGVPVVVAATTATPSTPHPNSGQGTGSGVVTPTIALGNVDADNYSAIVFVGGWGASSYQYAFSGTYAAPDNYYFNSLYNGDPIPGDGIIAPQKVAVNSLINEFLADDKPVAAICHGVTVLAWARVSGVSPIAGKNIVVPHTDGTPAMFYSGTTYSNGFAQGQYLQAKAHGAKVSAIGGQVGNPTTAADDVVVDGRIITAENQTSAAYFGVVIANEVIGDPPTPIAGPAVVTISEGGPAFIAQYSSTDPEGKPLSWFLQGPAPIQSLFNISSTGVLSSKVELDGPFTGGIYVACADVNNNVVELGVTISVQNAAPTVQALTGPATLNVGEVGTFQLTGVSDVAADMATMKYSYWVFGTELPAPNYDKASPLIARALTQSVSGTYTISGRAYDKDGGISETKSLTFIVNAPPTPIVGPTDISIPEGVPGTIAQFSSTDPEGGPISWSVDGPNATKFNISSTGVLSSTVEFDGPTSLTVQITATDQAGAQALEYYIIKLSNVAPTVASLTGPTVLIQGETATFTPSGVSDIAADQKTMKYIHWKLPPIPLTTYDNAVSTPGATYSFTTPGTHTVYSRAIDKDGGVSETKSLTITVLAPPTVNSLTINGGQTQRSSNKFFVGGLSWIEMAPVASALSQPGAIFFTRNGGTTVANSSGSVTFTVTFTESINGVDLGLKINPQAVHPGLEHGSLADGRWQLRIPLLNYVSPQFHRLFGDGNGDATVDATDLALFGVDFGTTGESPFDFNGDNTVDASDYSHWGNRFGTTI